MSPGHYNTMGTLAHWLVTAAFPLIGYLAFYVVPRKKHIWKEHLAGNKYLEYCEKVRRWL